VTIKNYSSPVTNLTAYISSNDPWISIDNRVASFGIIDRYHAITNVAEPFRFTISPGVPQDHIAEFNLELSVNGTVVGNDIITLRLASHWRQPQELWSKSVFRHALNSSPDERLIALLDLDASPKQGIFTALRESDGPWTPTYRISSNAGHAHTPSMDIGPDGDIHVVYERNVGSWDNEIFYARYDAATGIWSPEEQLTSQACIFWENYPDWQPDGNYVITADANGLIHVVWIDYRSGDPQVYYKYHDGTSWHTEEFVIDVDLTIWNCNNCSNNAELNMFEASDGNRYVFWNIVGIHGDQYVMSGSDTTWNSPHRVRFLHTKGSPFLQNGDIYICYKDNDADVLKLAQFNGTDWLDVDILDEQPLGWLTLPDDGTIRLAYDWNDYGIVWIDMVTRDTGGLWSSPRRITTYDMHHVFDPYLVTDTAYDNHILANAFDIGPLYFTTSMVDADLLPTRPAVFDDGDITYDPVNLHASWLSSYISGIAKYKYAIGTAPGQADVVDWITFTSTTNYTKSMNDIPLLSGQPYYVTIRSTCNAIYSSPLGFSDGIIYQPDGLPDLNVIEVTCPSPISPDMVVSVACEIENSGMAAADGSWIDQYYLSADDTIGKSDIKLLAFRKSDTLDSMDSYTAFASLSVPVGFVGDYYIGTYTDVDFAITEDNENNNSKATTSIVTITPPAAASIPFVDNFESNDPQTGWSFFSNTSGQIRISDDQDAHSGFKHLLMDSTYNSSLNEAVLTLDLAGFSDVFLDFWQCEFNDEDNPLPDTSWSLQTESDGVSISQDGITWYPILSLVDTSSTNDYQKHVIDLDAAIQSFGIGYDHDFHIKFQQFDNISIPSDGFAIDDVRVFILLPGDFDHDGDIDNDDLDHVLACISGAGIPQNDPVCQDADLDKDGDVDQDDFGLLQRCFSGPGIPPDPDCASSMDPAPVITGAFSRKLHNTAGEFDIDLGINNRVEPRLNGPEKIIIEFSETVQPVDGQLDGSEISLSHGSLESAVLNDRELHLMVSNVPDQSCLTLTVEGLEDQTGHALEGENELQIKVLLGDIYPDGMVNIFDFEELKKCIYHHTNNEICRVDINLDGIINIFDLETLRSNLFKTINCP